MVVKIGSEQRVRDRDITLLFGTIYFYLFQAKIAVHLLLSQIDVRTRQSFMLSWIFSLHKLANSSMPLPLLIFSASNGTMLCWYAGAFDVAAGCVLESITLSSGIRSPSSSRIERRSSRASYVKSRGSVRGAYGLKSRMWARDRSRVKRRSKVSTLLSFGAENEHADHVQSSVDSHLVSILDCQIFWTVETMVLRVVVSLRKS